MRITGVDSTELFTGTAAQPRQVIRVSLANAGQDVVTDPLAAVTVEVSGRDVATPEPVVLTGLAPGSEHIAEVAIAAAGRPGARLPVVATISWPGGSARLAAAVTVAEPGWVMWMVSHFHYDPVWWATQGQFLQSRVLLPDSAGILPEVRTAFELVRLHLDAARRDPDYKFVLAEIDYLKPHFDAHPEDRADLLDLISAGRIELVGGSYNEPNTNLTGVESTIRNAIYGIAYQRGVLGGDPQTSWMLDAFGFDPAYPSIMAAAGLSSSAWARGPFHQWGPNRSVGDNRLMQFASEFEWLSGAGDGLLTSYMANHYGAGWVLHQAGSLAEAEAAAYAQFRQLAPVAATRNVLLPVGADHVIPARWATALHRDWNARYLWPRFVTAVPSEFFSAVRADAAERGIWLTPQTRDMNPVYTGKDVSYIDTKQGQRAAEIAMLEGERLATLAWLAGSDYPAASIDKGWRQLAFGAHHDAITGTESDQVYLDLLAGWREAWQRGDEARTAAARHLAGLADTAQLEATAADAGQGAPWPLALVVVNAASLDRSAMATAELDLPPGWPGWVRLCDDAGADVPFLAEGAVHRADGGLSSVTITFRAAVPGVGFRSYLIRPAAGPAAAAGWQPVPGQGAFRLENESFMIEADAAHGGTLTTITDKRTGTELLAPGGGGNELLLQPEHPAHPRWAEGPWLLCPAGPATGTSAMPAAVRAERCPVGARLIARTRLGGLQVTQETLLWDGSDRVEFRTHVDGSIGQDQLLRVSFPVSVPGGLPVYQTAVGAIGRTPGVVDTDVAEHPYTLDSPASEWLATGSTASVALAGCAHSQAIGVAEVIAPAAARLQARAVLAALARSGVTATCTLPDGPRYGYQELDSNLPDFRLCLGGPADNSLTARVLAAAGPAAAAALDEQLAATGAARLWLPAARARSDAFAPGADLRGTLDLPVLVVAAADLDAELGRLCEDLADAVIDAVPAPSYAEASGAAGGPATALAGHAVALLNRGTPSGLVTPDGSLTMALMRACSTWPCGVWTDGEKRTAPDGSSFAWQHWSHTFEYALAAGTGDWRSAGFSAAGQDYNHDLLTTVTGLHQGPLPATARLVAVAPATALLSALKPRGNPLAPAGQPGRASGVTLRLRDIGGRGTSAARVALFTGIAAAAGSGLCEDADGAALPVTGSEVEVSVPSSGLVTFSVQPGATIAATATGPAGHDAGPPGHEAGAPGQASAPEPAQPVYARYWLHGKGPAPAGNMPVAVHLSPAAVPLDDGATGTLRLTVACGPDPAAGQIRLDAPPGISLSPCGPLSYDLAPLGFTAIDLAVTAAPGTSPGRRFVTAAISDAAGQVIEDSALVAIGQPPGPAPGNAVLDEVLAQQLAADAALAGEAQVTVGSRNLTVPAGGSAEIEVSITNRAQSPIRGEAQLISPFGSWSAVGPWAAGFAVEPGECQVLHFPVRPAATARPGQRWWALVKVMYFGRLRYSEPVEVTIAGPA